MAALTWMMPEISDEQRGPVEGELRRRERVLRAGGPERDAEQ